MRQGFTFERALAYPFAAPHFGSFPWIFGASFALAFIALTGMVALLGREDFLAWAAYLESIEGTTGGPEALELLMGTMMARLLPWSLLFAFGGWVLWAMFESASQRRYIWGRSFSLGFGAGELRMMVVGLLWVLLYIVMVMLPYLLIAGAALGLLISDMGGPEPAAADTRAFGALFGGVTLMMFVLFPAYVFVATRLSPCFGLTVKDGAIRFFDAWNVSRGRFWPILAAFVILLFGAGVVFQVVFSILMGAAIPIVLSGMPGETASAAEVAAYFASPGFLILMGALLFGMMFAQGLLQHLTGGPAALAARHDPRNDIDDIQRADLFS